MTGPTFNDPLVVNLAQAVCARCRKRLVTQAAAEDLVYDGEVLRCPLCWGKEHRDRAFAMQTKATAYLKKTRPDHPDAERDPVAALGQVAVDLKQALNLTIPATPETKTP